MGPVVQAVRRMFAAPVTLHTLGQRKAFILAEVDSEGIVLLLGRSQAAPHCRGSAWSPSRRSSAGTADGLRRAVRGVCRGSRARWMST